jgi:hypothetical protein
MLAAILLLLAAWEMKQLNMRKYSNYSEKISRVSAITYTKEMISTRHGAWCLNMSRKQSANLLN